MPFYPFHLIGRETIIPIHGHQFSARLLRHDTVIPATFPLPIIVGYANKDVGKFDMVCNTFLQIGVSEADITLGQISVNSVISDETGEVLSGWDMNNDKILLYDASGRNIGLYYNLPQAYIDIDPYLYEGSGAGWYPDNNFRKAECVNDYKLPNGTGILVKAADGKNAKLIFNGEVKQAPNDIDVGRFVIAGNSSPVEIKLGDITVNSVISDETGEVLAGWDMNNDKILLYDADGRNIGLFYNLPQAYIDIDPYLYEGSVAGWYPDNNFRRAECMNNYPLPPGSAFLVKAADGIQPVITIPSPIKTQNK